MHGPAPLGPDWRKNLIVGGVMVTDAKSFYDYMHKQHGSLNGTLNAFIPELSKNLSSEVLLYLRIGLVTNVPFFQVENATRARLASACA